MAPTRLALFHQIHIAMTVRPARRLLFIVGAFALALLLIIFYSHSSKLELKIVEPRELEDVLLSSFQPPLGKSIFFHETSCSHPNGGFEVMNLTARQACSVESAARNNPGLQVFLIFSCPTLYPFFGSQKQLIDAVKSYENVNFRVLNLWSYTEGTPVGEWMKKDELRNSSHPIEHVSDLLRLVSLYHFGGIYLDMDMVVLKSMEAITPNYAVDQDGLYLGNAVICLEPTGKGHEIAELFLDHYQKNYGAHEYTRNGPVLVTNVLTKYCNQSIIKVMEEGPESCNGFRIFHPTAFYSIPYPQWNYFTDPKYTEETLKRTSNSYAIHLWNKLSGNTYIKVGSDAALGKFAEKHCPKTYAAAGEHF